MLSQTLDFVRCVKNISVKSIIIARSHYGEEKNVKFVSFSLAAHIIDGSITAWKTVVFFLILISGVASTKFTGNFSKGCTLFLRGFHSHRVGFSVQESIFCSIFTSRINFVKNTAKPVRNMAILFFPASHQILIDTSQLYFNSFVVTDKEEQPCEAFSRYDRKDTIRSAHLSVKNCRTSKGLHIARKWEILSCPRWRVKMGRKRTNISPKIYIRLCSLQIQPDLVVLSSINYMVWAF